jgi:hypothetical protein
MLRFLGAGAILLAVTSAASAGERYIEVWNPPEARATAPHAAPLHKHLSRRHAAHQAVKFRARQIAAAVPKLVAKRSRPEGALRAPEPDVTDLPRQMTPEGNILRVDSRQASAGVLR